MTLPKSRDEQVAWFHRLADLPRDQLNEWAELCQDFMHFVEWHLPGSNASEPRSPEELSHAASQLRENERSWNRALMLALTTADEQFRQELPSVAKHHLHQFAASCPWRLFKEVAETQASNY